VGYFRRQSGPFIKINQPTTSGVRISQLFAGITTERLRNVNNKLHGTSISLWQSTGFNPESGTFGQRRKIAGNRK
jgi:hypothetical protein